ncbi:MAG: uroporphyrinogen decarboxylase family protein, partial [Chloroflexota bacterium]|nr:uroporphyrinogen decarboxylase family protein [Chloroflexota bacterium]
MDARERFLRVAQGQPVDRVPYLEEAIREEVLRRWRREGLSRSVTEDNYRQFFGLDKHEYFYLAMEPPLHGSLKSRHDFQRLQDAYRSYLPDFRQPRFWRDKANRHRGRDYPLGVMGWRGLMLPLFTHRREWSSLRDVLLALHDHPQPLKDALELVADCYIETVRLALQHLEFDFGLVSEPIASPTGPVISPAMYREFVLPPIRRVVAFFHEQGVRPVIFRSLSNANAIVPMAVEAGADGLWIGQTAGVVDYVALRKAYPHLLLMGGLDSTVLARDEAAIQAEVDAKVPFLLASGRYLPFLDDNPREHIPYRNYVFYR